MKIEHVQHRADFAVFAALRNAVFPDIASGFSGDEVPALKGGDPSISAAFVFPCVDDGADAAEAFADQRDRIGRTPHQSVVTEGDPDKSESGDCLVARRI